jgi:hypothetical protein
MVQRLLLLAASTTPYLLPGIGLSPLNCLEAALDLLLGDVAGDVEQAAIRGCVLQQLHGQLPHDAGRQGLQQGSTHLVGLLCCTCLLRLLLMVLKPRTLRPRASSWKLAMLTMSCTRFLLSYLASGTSSLSAFASFSSFA